MRDQWNTLRRTVAKVFLYRIWHQPTNNGKDAMSEQQSIRMSEAGDRFSVAADYHVQLPPGDHLLVVAGGQEATRFDHPNLVARVPRVWEFKHYHSRRGKWWSQKAGIDLHFVVSKTEIELLPEKGYSYVPVRIGGRKFVFNVSGGSSPNGWTDYIRPQVHTSVGLPKSALNSLGSVALCPAQILELGLGFDISPLSEDQQQTYQELAVKRDVQQADIKQLVLGRFVSWRGQKGPFAVVSRSPRHREFTIEDEGWRCRVKYSQIDWLQTAIANEIDLPNAVAMNRVGGIEELQTT